MTAKSQPINVPFLDLNQSGPASGMPAGALALLRNAMVRYFDNGRNRIEKRWGFQQQTVTVLNPTSGNASGNGISDPHLLGTLGDRLIAASASNLFALSEANQVWENPPYHYLSNELRRTNVPFAGTSDGGTQVLNPDSARIGARTLYVWGTNISTLTNSLNMALVDDDGTVIRSATLPTLFTSGNPGQIRVVVDSSNTRFWIVNSTALQINATVVNLDGKVLASDSITQNNAPNGSYFDVQASTTSSVAIWVVQKTPAAATFDITQFDFNAGPVTVTHTIHTVAGTLTSGKVQFLVNVFGGTDIWVAAINGAGPYDYRVYTLTAFIVTHTYTIATAQARTPCEIVGITAGGGGSPTIRVALAFTDVAVAPGPFTFRNSTDIYEVTFAGVSTLVTTKLSFTPVTRAIFINGVPYVVMYYQADPLVTGPVAQSTFFLMKFNATWDICGRWESGTAYADWQNDRTPTGFVANGAFHMHVSTPTTGTDNNIHFTLAYRISSQTSKTSVQGVSGDTVWFNAPTASIGIRDYYFPILPIPVEPIEASGELLLPGLEPTAYSGGQFAEDGFALIPEIISLTPAAGGSMTPKLTYTYCLGVEWTDDAGNVVRSPIGAPMSTTMGAAETQVTIVGTNVFNTRKNNVRIIIGRTANISGQQTTSFYRLIPDSQPLLNNTGAQSWTFVDKLADTTLALADTIYTSKGFTDRFPAPPGPGGGCANADRMFVIGYDNAIWFSGPKTEGDAWWFSPAFRIPLPTSEKLKKLVIMDSFLVAFCDKASVFAVPITNLPDATGAGPIGSPLLLPFNNGCNGFAALIDQGILYASAQGGIWLVTRSLENVYFGLRAKNDVELGGQITAMCGDKHQRIYACLSNGTIEVYDQISKQWYNWRFDAGIDSPITLTIHRGMLTFSNSVGVWQQVANTYADVDINASRMAISMSLATTQLYFGGIRGFVRLWNAEFFGDLLGAHDLTITATFYRDDEPLNTPVTATYSFTPDLNRFYVFQLPPTVEEISHVTYTIVETAVADSAGGAWEGMGFELAIDPNALGRVSTNRTIKGT